MNSHSLIGSRKNCLILILCSFSALLIFAGFPSSLFAQNDEGNFVDSIIGDFAFEGNFDDLSGKGASIEESNVRNINYELYLNGGLRDTEDAYSMKVKTPALSYDSFSVALRFWAASFDEKSKYILVGGKDENWFSLYRAESGNLAVSLNDQDFVHEFEDAPLQEKKWYALICSVSLDERIILVYLNGKEIGEVELPRNFRLTVAKTDRKGEQKVWTFKDSQSSACFDGYLDDLIIYGRLLEFNEMAEIPLRYLNNLALGDNSLMSNQEGDGNTSLGVCSLQFNIANSNTAVGAYTLRINSTGLSNTAVGQSSMINNTTGNYNTSIGNQALFSNGSGISNTAVGSSTLYNNSNGNWNVAVGLNAMLNNTSGVSNTALGTESLQNNTTGNNNIAIGVLAGNNLTTGSHNIMIGNKGVAEEEKTIRIGDSDNHTRTFIAGITGVTTGVNDGVPVMIDSQGQLGTISSSVRYKEDIQDLSLTNAIELLQKLRPVTFRYKKAFQDGQKPIQYGLIAEEVAEVFPELVVFNQEGKPESVKYHLLTTLLLEQVKNQEEQFAAIQKTAAEQTEQLQKKVEQIEKLQKQILAAEGLELRLQKLEATINKSE